MKRRSATKQKQQQAEPRCYVCGLERPEGPLPYGWDVVRATDDDGVFHGQALVCPEHADAGVSLG